MTWYVLQHRPAQGQRALTHLQNQAIECFYPQIQVEKIKNGKRCKKNEPLFCGYVFINLEITDPRWHKLRSTRGVSRVVSFAGKPAPLDDAVIMQIKSGWRAVKDQGGIQRGQKIHFQSGPFAGIEAVFQRYSGEERAIVLLDFMQKQQRVRVPLATLDQK